MEFSNPEHALRWSYETSNRPIVKISSVNEMRGPERIGGGSSSDELTAHDYHAQAALILGLCERVLSPLHMAYVRVQFGREASGFDLLARHLAGSFGTGALAAFVATPCAGPLCASQSRAAWISPTISVRLASGAKV